MIKVSILDDHPSIRQAYSTSFEKSNDIELLDAVGSGSTLLGRLTNSVPDVLILDYSLGGEINGPVTGLDLAEKILQKWPDVKILMATMHKSIDVMIPCLKAGIKGYILKSEVDFDICHAVRELYGDGRYFSPEVESLRRNYIKKQIDLSDRELQVLEQVSLGKKAQQIGDFLFISPNTVETHRKKLLLKFEATNSANLVRKAADLGYFQHSKSSLD